MSTFSSACDHGEKDPGGEATDPRAPPGVKTDPTYYIYRRHTGPAIYATFGGPPNYTPQNIIKKIDATIYFI
jgi:hypothetical protein